MSQKLVDEVRREYDRLEELKRRMLYQVELLKSEKRVIVQHYNKTCQSIEKAERTRKLRQAALEKKAILQQQLEEEKKKEEEETKSSCSIYSGAISLMEDEDLDLDLHL